jgi:hypothetical protein
MGVNWPGPAHTRRTRASRHPEAGRARPTRERDRRGVGRQQRCTRGRLCRRKRAAGCRSDRVQPCHLSGGGGGGDDRTPSKLAIAQANGSEARSIDGQATLLPRQHTIAPGIATTGPQNDNSLLSTICDPSAAPTRTVGVRYHRALTFGSQSPLKREFVDFSRDTAATLTRVPDSDLCVQAPAMTSMSALDRARRQSRGYLDSPAAQRVFVVPACDMSLRATLPCAGGRALGFVVNTVARAASVGSQRPATRHR